MLTRFARRGDAMLFVAGALVALVLSTLAIGASLTRVGHMFPGFVVWDNLSVVVLGRGHWTGLEARVPFRARVVSIDGRPVASRADLYAALEAAPAGIVLHEYVFDGPQGRETRSIAAQPFTKWDWASTMGVYALNGVVFLLVGLAVFYLKPELRQSRALLACSMVWGLTLVLCVDLFTVGVFDRLCLVLEALAPAAALHLALTFPSPRGPLRRNGRAMLWLYGAGLVAGIAEVATFWRSYQTCLAIEYGVYLALAGSGIALIASLADGAARGATPLARRRGRVVLVGALVAFLLPLVALLGSVLFGQHVSFSLLALGGFIFPASIGYAIARHDLFEADRVVKLSLVYAALTLMVSLLYAGTVVLADRLVAESPVSRSPLFPIGFVMLALATVVPLRDRVQRAVDRLFYRSRVDFKDTVARASGRMTTLLDREAIVEHVTSTLRDVLFVEGATVWERDGDLLVRRGGAGRLPTTDPGLVVFEAQQRMLSRDEVDESLRLRAARPALRALFEALDASLLVPLSHQGRGAGILAVGRKAAGGGLSADDVDVLATLANETAVALANASAVEQLDAAREGLRRAEHLAAIGELSAAVAHGIRNPLAGIRLAAQLGLEHALADGPVRESLEDVLAEVDKLESQVRGILDFARPFEPRLEATDLPALVRSVLETLTSRLDATGVAVAVDLPADLPAVRADRAHLGQVFQELVANAIEAMPTGGRLIVSAASSGNGNGVPRIRLAVADSGPGVPAEMRERIFRIFTTTKQTGTGVGLAVVRKIVERHGGRVIVESAEPQGARFVVELPAA